MLYGRRNSSRDNTHSLFSNSLSRFPSLLASLLTHSLSLSTYTQALPLSTAKRSHNSLFMYNSASWSGQWCGDGKTDRLPTSSQAMHSSVQSYSAATCVTSFCRWRKGAMGDGARHTHREREGKEGEGQKQRDETERDRRGRNRDRETDTKRKTERVKEAGRGCLLIEPIVFSQQQPALQPPQKATSHPIRTYTRTVLLCAREVCGMCAVHSCGESEGCIGAEGTSSLHCHRVLRHGRVYRDCNLYNLLI